MHGPILSFGDFITRDGMTIFVSTTLIGIPRVYQDYTSQKSFHFMGEWVLSRDFPDGSRSDVHIRALPASLQDRSEVWMATVTLVGFA
jgi:hypothetical protein